MHLSSFLFPPSSLLLPLYFFLFTLSSFLFPPSSILLPPSSFTPCVQLTKDYQKNMAALRNATLEAGKFAWQMLWTGGAGKMVLYYI